MALDRDAALSGAIAWLMAIREIARTDVGVANLLIDAHPEGCPSLASLVSALDDPSRLTEEEKDFIRQGKHIPAIKEIRIRTKLGLKECKLLADSWRDSEIAAGRLTPKTFPVSALPPPLPALPDGTRIVTPRRLDLDDNVPFHASDETPFAPGCFSRDDDTGASLTFPRD